MAGRTSKGFRGEVMGKYSKWWTRKVKEKRGKEKGQMKERPVESMGCEYDRERRQGIQVVMMRNQSKG